MLVNSDQQSFLNHAYIIPIYHPKIIYLISSNNIFKSQSEARQMWGVRAGGAAPGPVDLRGCALFRWRFSWLVAAAFLLCFLVSFSFRLFFFLAKEWLQVVFFFLVLKLVYEL